MRVLSKIAAIGIKIANIMGVPFVMMLNKIAQIMLFLIQFLIKQVSAISLQIHKGKHVLREH